ncbi:MAG: S-adenosyl-l-methionine hydroxide adenosyltransferase family protein [Cyclobacteriaceae bacterium]
MSDFGTTDHYVAAVKAKILSVNPSVNIVDISHYIDAHNLAHAAYVLGSCFRMFPKGTVHLAAVDSVSNRSERYIAVNLEGHFFIGCDNGLFGLISEKEPAFIAELLNQSGEVFTFPARDIMAKAAALLASGSNLDDVGKFSKEYQRLIGRKPKATKKQISGHVIRVDHYGNLITNIDGEVFNTLSKEKKYSVCFAREKVRKVNKNFSEVESGDCFVLFNSGGLLEIGINKGNAAELLGLRYDSPVNIIFDEENV